MSVKLTDSNIATLYPINIHRSLCVLTCWPAPLCTVGKWAARMKGCVHYDANEFDLVQSNYVKWSINRPPYPGISRRKKQLGDWIFKGVFQLQSSALPPALQPHTDPSIATQINTLRTVSLCQECSIYGTLWSEKRSDLAEKIVFYIMLLFFKLPGNRELVVLDEILNLKLYTTGETTECKIKGSVELWHSPELPKMKHNWFSTVSRDIYLRAPSQLTLNKWCSLPGPVSQSLTSGWERGPGGPGRAGQANCSPKIHRVPTAIENPGFVLHLHRIPEVSAS